MIELLMMIAILAIVTTMIYSVYSGFVRHATAERKTAKTELDLVNVYWPLTKEIESAGFGLASSGTTTCVQSQAISVSGNEVTIHSTASGDDALAGAWGHVNGAVCATGISAASPNNNVVVIGSLDKKYIKKTTVDSSGNLTVCTSDDSGAMVYWIPSASNLECYETKYALADYIAERPNMCAPDTDIKQLCRSVSQTTTPNFEPILDCVRDLDYRFGCINASGNLTWQSTLNCGTAKLRLIKVGIIVQSSTRLSSQVPPDIILFEDLSTALRKTVTLTDDQRYYRWKKREQIITLRNLE